MDEVKEFFKKYNKNLKKEYKNHDGRGKGACSQIAFEIAKILFSQGKKPYVIRIEEENREYLYPKIFRNITWDQHIVCCRDVFGMRYVYDPVFPRKTRLKKYLKKMFDEKVKITTIIKKKNVKKELRL